jgi:antitoxin (DNA-binding transcriptional repressor) of toxin-antitoxin stability system
MSTISIEDAEVQLRQLIAGLKPGDEIIIADQGQPVARLIAEPSIRQQRRKLGTMPGSVLHMAPDFDAPLEDFKEYME